MKRVDDYQESKNKLYRKFDVDGYLIEPDCNDIVLRLLNIIFSDSSEVDAINVYCLDNHYGIGKNNKTYINGDGQKITIVTPEDLYKYLISNIHTKDGD